MTLADCFASQCARRVVVAYQYDLPGRLTRAEYPETGETPETRERVAYDYSALNLRPAFSVRRGTDVAEQVLSTKLIDGPGIEEPDSFGVCSALVPTVSEETSQDGATFYRPGVCSRPLNFTDAVRPTVSGATITRSFTSRDGLTTDVQLACSRAAGAQCIDVKNVSASWNVATFSEPVDLVRRDFRGSTTVNQVQQTCWPEGCASFEASNLLSTEVMQVDEGATGANCSFGVCTAVAPLRSTRLAWQYLDTRNTHERLPHVSSVGSPSVFQCR